MVKKIFTTKINKTSKVKNILFISSTSVYGSTQGKISSETIPCADSKNGIEILKTEPELYAEIWAIHHISNRRWDVHLKNGIKIKLPENAPGVAWSKLARLEHKNEIIQRDLAVIDLRLQNQILVEPNLPIRSKGQQT